MNSPTILALLALAASVLAVAATTVVIVRCDASAAPAVRPADRALIRDVVDGFHRLAPSILASPRQPGPRRLPTNQSEAILRALASKLGRPREETG